MSVHIRTRSKGRKAYQVLWRDEAGQQRSATFRTKREAEQRDREIEDLRERGRFGAIDAGSEPLVAAIESWWTDHVEPTVSLNTRKVYATCLDRYLLPRLGKVPIRDIDSGAVIGLQRDLRDAGVGEAMNAKVLMVLSGIMRHSQLLGRIHANPVSPVRIPQGKRRKVIRPLTPAVVEQMRASLTGTHVARDATILSVLAYAGLRPGEALTLTWECVGQRTLVVEHGRADGSVKETKTDRIRTVGLLAPVAADLRAWRKLAPKSADRDTVFARPDGDVFRDTDYRNWRRRSFEPAAAAVGAIDATPYTLRHSFASLLVQAGWNPLEISAEMGNSPEVVQRDYSHIFREFARGERLDAEATILTARRFRHRASGSRSERNASP